MNWEEEEEDDRRYIVVLNHEEQYSIWLAHRDIPAGWRSEGFSGSKTECLDHIDQVWTDMRPLSLRRWLEDIEQNPPEDGDAGELFDGDGPTLVDRLCAEWSPVEIVLRPEPTIEGWRERLRMGSVLVRFTGTRGGTELLVQLDNTAPLDEDASNEIGSAAGTFHIQGCLNLDFVPCRCEAEIDLTTFAGRGRLQRAERIAGHGEPGPMEMGLV